MRVFHAVLTILAVAASLAAASPARADWPERPIRIVVPFPPGGAADQTARGLGERLARDLGGSVVVENKPGANTIIGVDAVAKAEPDGYTLLMSSGSGMVLNPLMYKSLPYDAQRDLRTLAIVTEAPLLLVVHPAVPATTVRELVAWAKKQGDKVNYASTGLGNTTQLAAELFKDMAGLSMTHVPYKGSAPALTDLVAGQVQVMFDIVTSAMPQAQAGSLRGLAVTTGTRLPLLPDMPTVAESGFPDYQASAWYGIAAPAKLPEPLARRLMDAIARAQGDTALKASLEKLGFVVAPPRDGAAIQRFLDEDRARWAAIVRSRNIVLE